MLVVTVYNVSNCPYEHFLVRGIIKSIANIHYKYYYYSTHGHIQ